MKKRIAFFDIAKGIGIICVILGHLGFGSRIFSTFHMPLFFLISGYFYKYSKNKDFISKKAKQLLIPYLFTGICIIILDFAKKFAEHLISGTKIILDYDILTLLYGSGYKTIEIFGINIGAIGAIWFLLALFEALVIINITNNIKFQPIIIVAIATVGYYSAKYIWLPFSIQAGMLASLFVYIGMLVKKLNLSEKMNEKHINTILTLIAFSIWGLGIIFNVKISMVQNVLSHGIISIIVAICGTYSVIQISKLIENIHIFKTDKLLKIIGENTLIILCFHLIELNIFPWHMIKLIIHNSYISKFMIVFLKILWLTLTTVCVYKIPILSKVFSIKKENIEKDTEKKQLIYN
jgi:fucose 4-O-acetylase-like acetyltransferase